MIAQLVKGQAKVIYDNQKREIAKDDHYDWAARQRKANYNLHKESIWYFKKKYKDDMDASPNYVFGSGLLGNFAYTV